MEKETQKHKRVAHMQEGMLQKQARILFSFIIAIGMSGVVSALFFLWYFFPTSLLAGGILLGKKVVTCGCVPLLFSDHSKLFLTALAVSGGIFLLFFISMVRALKLYVSTKGFIRQYMRWVVKERSLKLKDLSQELGIDKKVIEIAHQDPVVFCFGLWQPKICISSALVSNLEREELKAVLLHEQHHTLSHEPLKLFLARSFSYLCFFIFGFEKLIQRYHAFAELAADERATYGFSDKRPLARALEKALAWKEAHRNGGDQVLALSFFSATLGERVHKLTDVTYVPSFRSLGTTVLVSVAALIGIFGILSFITPIHTTLATTQGGVCQEEVREVIGSCDAHNAPMSVIR